MHSSLVYRGRPKRWARMSEQAKNTLRDLLTSHRGELIERATDWVFHASIDLRGQRPRQETRALVERVVGFNEALILAGNEGPLRDFIPYVTHKRATDGFHVSTLLMGFLSFRMAVVQILPITAISPAEQFALLDLVDNAYFRSIFLMADEYVIELHQEIVNNQIRYERERRESAEERMREMDTAMTVIQSQQEMLQDLSLPVIRVWEGVLVVPLIGKLTQERLAGLLPKVLESTAKERAKFVLLDITGLQDIDGHTAPLLYQTTQATRLIGTTTLVVGVSAEIAHSFVKRHNLTLHLRTYASVADALQVVLTSLAATRRPTGKAPARKSSSG